jgi:membrane peptidoglycan carboxypeptidase
MRREGMLTDDQADDAKGEPLDVKPASEQRWKHPYFVDLVLRQLGVLRSPGGLDPRFDLLGSTRKERGSNVYLRGLRIHTTLDPNAQQAAEEAVNLLPSEFERLSVALASIEPANGYIRALIGGRDYYPDCENEKDQETHRCRLAKVNLALGRYAGGSGRQPGSSFKPFVLATALERGVPLHQTFSGAPFTHPLQGSAPWKVRNYEGSSGGSTTLIDGTARSVNAVFARLEIEGAGDGDAFLGASRVAQTARRMGIDFPTPEELRSRCGDDFAVTDRCIPADNVPAIALGAKEVSPLAMASAYATFANDGTRLEPTAIVRIQDAQGRVLYDADPGSVRAIPQGVARGVTYALQQVLARGTGTRAAIDRPAAAKTGTSQEWRDAWLAGYVPQLATVVWVGNPLHALESMTPANGYPTRIVGGSYPAMIWHDYMTQALQGVPVVEFKAPPSQLFRGTRSIASPEPSPTPTPTGSPEPEELESEPGQVPSVIGMSFGDAGSTLRSRGFDPDTERGCDPSGDADLHEVYAQSPEAGAEVPQGSTVTVFYQGAC